MGFYYGPGGDPPKDDKPGFRETITIIWVVFQALALPVGIIIGGLLAIVLVIWLFTIAAYLGFILIGIIVAALVARAVWEAKHPPDLS